MNLRIAVLNANTDRSAFSQRWPDDAQKVIRGLAPLRSQWSFQAFQARDGELPEADAADAWIITGSVDSVNDEAPWKLELEQRLRERDAHRQCTVGLCFGHQLIAKALGGRVGPSPAGWRIGTAPTRYNELLPWMQPPQRDIRLFAAHCEQVLQPPPQAVVIGGDVWAPVGALQVGTHMMSTQYHPELTLEFMRELLTAFADHWTPELVTQAREQVEQPVDAQRFMRWVASFIEQAQEASA